MNKKTKLLSIFSFTILAPFNSLLISCGEQKLDSSTPALNSSVNYSENEGNELNINQEIKNSILSGVYPDEDQSILVVKELVSNVIANEKEQKLESVQVENFLDNLASKLNKNKYDDKIELKGNKIIENGLKKVIYENCRVTSNSLRTKHIDEFGEVTNDKILEVNEDALVFELKPFGIDKILHDIGYDQESEQETKIADSQALKIYKFSTNLKLTVNKGGDKKAIVNINDLNLFVVSDKEQAKMLKEGINSYLKKKFEKTIFLYLNGNELGGNSNDREINKHFSEILEKNNYDLVNNENSKKQLISYLSNIYLPKLIYKKSVQGIETDDQQAKSIIKIDSKSLILNSNKSAFLEDGMEFFDEDFAKELNFLNFFKKGNHQGETDMDEESFKKIKPEHFLRDKTIYEEKYYSLTSGIFNINQWSIRGFQIPGIEVKFELLIHCEILKKHIENLQTCLRNVLSEMKKSRIWKFEEGSESNNYVVQIYLPSSSSSLYSKIRSKLNKKGVFFEDLLNMAYIDPARKKSEEMNFSPAILKNMTFNFLVKHSNSEEKLVADKRTITGDINENVNELKGPIEIYFIFNSFKIKLTDSFFVSKLNNNQVNRFY